MTKRQRVKAANALGETDEMELSFIRSSLFHFPRNICTYHFELKCKKRRKVTKFLQPAMIVWLLTAMGLSMEQICCVIEFHDKSVMPSNSKRNLVDWLLRSTIAHFPTQKQRSESRFACIARFAYVRRTENDSD